MAQVSSQEPRATVRGKAPRPQWRPADRTAVGRRPAPDGPRVQWLECQTDREVRLAMEGGEVDLAILDGEAQPTGGMGLSRQYKYEIRDCPPIVVLIARRQDAWISQWSLADAVIAQPVDPIAAAATVANLLTERVDTVRTVR